ncbi:hypothetical protein Lal_00039645 [Lupinus albus]|nr:hypothetical protein Lal_00039645 [Lupinus albus]
MRSERYLSRACSCDWDNYDRKRFYLYICRITKEEIERRKQQSLGKSVKDRDILSVGYLTLEDRLVHYFLTYVILLKISNYLQHFGVSLDGETKVALNLHETKVDIEVVHKMGFVLDLVTRRTYKHRTDRQTAPTDQPKPTAPNQPEFKLLPPPLLPCPLIR